MGTSEQQCFKETLAHATTDKWPKAQLRVALLNCSGIAAPALPRDTRACGEWLSTTLNSPALPTGKERDDIENDVSRLFDIRVTPKSGNVDTGFAQAVAPGLAALSNDFPGSAVRLAYIQACYLNPADRNAAKSTLNGVVQHYASQPEAANARKMLADLNSGQVGWCRN